MELDGEFFEREGWRPDALGIFVDADDRAPAERLGEYRAGLVAGEVFPSFSSVLSPGQVVEGGDGRRAGIFVFPDAERVGTIDSLLLELGANAFPELHEASRDFVEAWHPERSGGHLFRELRKPAGPRKAQLSAMAALLKPGKNLNASLQDHPWVPEGPPTAALRPLVRLLADLLPQLSPP